MKSIIPFLIFIFIFALSAFLCGQIDHRNVFLAAKERKEPKNWMKKSIIPFPIPHLHLCAL